MRAEVMKGLIGGLECMGLILILWCIVKAGCVENIGGISRVIPTFLSATQQTIL